MNTETDSTTVKHTIKRDGLPPIVFHGKEIASASNQYGSNGHRSRWFKVEIYRTKGGRYVASFNYFTQWQGESDHLTADSFDSASEVIGWLRLKDDDGQLGEVGQEAVEEAARNDPEFAAEWVEVVE